MGVKLRSVYGATEFGVPTHLFPTHEEDWKEWCWIEVDPSANLEWAKQSDGTEELIIPVRRAWSRVLCERLLMGAM